MSIAGLSDEDRKGLNTLQASQNGFDCTAGTGSYCGNQMRTPTVPGSNGGIFHRTKTTIVDGKATTEVYILSEGKWVNAAKTTDGGKTYTFSEATRSDGSKIVGQGVRESLGPNGDMNKNVKAQVTKTLKEGGASLTSQPKLTDQQIKTVGAVDTNTGTATSTSQAADDTAAEAKTTNAKTRKNYDVLQYPLNLRLENQDCIKFSIIEYVAPGLNPDTPNTSAAGSRIVQLNKDKLKRPGIGERKILGTITLPIPSGIGDRNSADWQGDQLDAITKAFADISMQTIVGGGEAGVDATKRNVGAATGDGGGSLKQTIASKLTESAVGTSNILARQFGAVANPNMELLFTGPSLRSFSFNFRFTPREPRESTEIKKIIRQFKQAMSVKRSASSLLLKAPHTFAISYLSNNSDHPYLNRFKECALVDCAVNYTPDGTYMTYGDSSMTAYELSLTFQELEPIFDDEYNDIDKNTDKSIGF